MLAPTLFMAPPMSEGALRWDGILDAGRPTGEAGPSPRTLPRAPLPNQVFRRDSSVEQRVPRSLDLTPECRRWAVRVVAPSSLVPVVL